MPGGVVFRRQMWGFANVDRAHTTLPIEKQRPTSAIR